MRDLDLGNSQSDVAISLGISVRMPELAQIRYPVEIAVVVNIPFPS